MQWWCESHGSSSWQPCTHTPQTNQISGHVPFQSLPTDSVELWQRWWRDHSLTHRLEEWNQFTRDIYSQYCQDRRSWFCCPNRQSAIQHQSSESGCERFLFWREEENLEDETVCRRVSPGEMDCSLLELEFYLNGAALIFNETNPATEQVRINTDDIKLTLYLCLVKLNTSVYMELSKQIWDNFPWTMEPPPKRSTTLSTEKYH